MEMANHLTEAVVAKSGHHNLDVGSSDIWPRVSFVAS